MDLKILSAVFWTVLLAELGDKTQLATFLYASDARNPKLSVFAGAAGALVLAAAIGVGVGAAVSSYVNPRILSWVAGVGFIGIGIWTIVRA